MTTEIKLVTAPVISHKLAEVGQSVTKRIQELNLANLIATDDTIQSLKTLRAELNKEFTEFETQRKALKTAVASPYQEFEAIYKVEIEEKFKQAGDTLKDKIGEFENKVKTEKKANIVAYFNELCVSAKIDFLKFEHTGLEINLSTSEKQYKEKCTEFVNRVQDDIMLINGMDFAPETLVEYKSNGFNASKAISTVRDREEAKKLEAERLKTIETNKRLSFLRALNMVYHDLTKTYNWVEDESVYIPYSDVENLSPDEFRKKYAELQSAIAEINKSKQEAPVIVLQVSQQPKQAPAPLEAPKEVRPEVQGKTFVAEFTVTGTMAQLMKLKEFLVSNNYQYKNI